MVPNNFKKLVQNDIFFKIWDRNLDLFQTNVKPFCERELLSYSNFKKCSQNKRSANNYLVSMDLEFMVVFVSMGNISLISLCHETISRKYIL